MLSDLALKAHGTHGGRWKNYPIYKESSVEWLGEVPEGWEIQKLKHIAKINLSNVNKKSSESEDPIKLCNYLDVYYNDYITSDLEFMEATASPNQIDKFTLIEGDVIITKDSESWEDIAVPAFVPADLKGVVCGYHLAHIRPNSDIKGEYLFWSLCVPRLNHQFRIEAHGITRFGLGKYSIDNSLFLLPPINEQKSIASFLYCETKQIDFLISKKERQIELLQNKRAALISHAVTKGLDPIVKMKDSGIELLGQIPEHWRTKRLKYISTVNDETLSETTDPDFELLYVDISNVDPVSGIKNKEPMTFENAPSRARRRVRHGDIIISTVRTYLRAISPINDPEPNLIVSTGFAVIRPKESIESQFAAYALRAPYFVEEVVANSVGVSYPAINASELITFNIALPPLPEQCTIAEFLDHQTGQIDALIEKVLVSIEKLRKYRTALISAAVTGKIDVRKELMT